MSLFGDLKSSLSGNQSVDPSLQTFLELEQKKQTIYNSAMVEIQIIMARIEKEQSAIGAKAYSLFREGKLSQEELAENFESLTKTIDTYEEKQNKLNEIMERYDGELQILRPASSEGAACPNCQKPYTAGISVFCSGCGCKL